MLLNGSLDGRGIGADNLLNLFTALEEQEGGHGADAQLLGDVGALVDVELDKFYVWVVSAVVLNLGGDGLARAAPGGEGVDHDELIALNGSIEL